LIGIPKALEIILAGKMMPAEDALKAGLVDEVVPREQLLEAACDRVMQPALAHRPHLRVSNNPVSAMLIRNRAARELAAKTRGNYPAAFEALEVVTNGANLPFDKALAREREAILRLAGTPECHHLIRLFLTTEHAKKCGPEQSSITRGAVIGAGVMGAGIAQWASSRGISVILRDVGIEHLIRGMGAISALYEDAVRRHHLTPLEARDGKDRIFAAATDLPLRDVEFVIEAAVEKLSVKQDIFRCLAAQTPPHAILATNTSALSVSEIAVAAPCPERVVGMHFFNPVHRMELVEVVAGAKTSSETLMRTAEFARRLGKLPVLVKDSPGFIVNRILMPYLAEAVRLLDAGASVQAIDEAMLDFGMPMGPLRLLDEVGIDVAAHVANTLGRALGERVVPSALLEKMMGANMLGRKTGRGFYDHLSGKPNHHLDVMRRVHRHAHFTHDELAQRLSLLMVNEAARCVEEEITGGPGIIDFAMVMGAGFAPFRGGPLRHADALGIRAIVEALDRLAKTEPWFMPCELLRDIMQNDDQFYGGRNPGGGSPFPEGAARDERDRNPKNSGGPK
jgi:3-hydroxyacyl-CoA dehydrogenase/enoyl-CoA hydratase/3-hydroxybutyryl-CoA epimerase